MTARTGTRARTAALTTRRSTVAVEHDLGGVPPPVPTRQASLATSGPGLVAAGAIALAGVLLAALEERLLGHALLEGLEFASPGLGQLAPTVSVNAETGSSRSRFLSGGHAGTRTPDLSDVNRTL